MNEKKIWTRGLIVLIVIVVVYSVVVFELPFPRRNEIFWLSYLFSLVALGAQIYIMQVAFKKGRGIKSKFYGFPIARIGVLYLLAQLILSLLFMSLAQMAPVWLPIIVYTVLLGVAAIGFVAADVMRDEVERQEVKLKKDVTCIRALQSKMASMVQLAQDAQVHKALEKFSEDLRFSDPVSGESLADIEADLISCVDELHRAVTDGDHGGTLSLIQKAEVILVERNRLCKLNKGSA